MVAVPFVLIATIGTLEKQVLAFLLCALSRLIKGAQCGKVYYTFLGTFNEMPVPTNSACPSYSGVSCRKFIVALTPSLF
jgi:hypothetical protein